MKTLIILAALLLPLCAFAGVEDWAAYSVIEKQEDGKAFKETVYLVNASTKTITLSFPNFQFPGHGDTPAESIGPMGNIVLAPGHAVKFVHIIPSDRKDGFTTSIGIQDVAEDIPVSKSTAPSSLPVPVEATFGAAQ